jgi:RNA polymerase sigma factor for flagellar operon FliA
MGLSDERRRLIEDHVYVADQCVSVTCRKLPPYVDQDELRSVAYEALIEASGRFDADKGSKFATFAWFRMHGAMIDRVRSSTGVRTGKPVRDPAEHYGERGNPGPRRVPPSKLTSLAQPLPGMDGVTVADTIAEPVDFTESLSDSEYVRRAVARLPVRERFIVLARMAGYTQDELAGMLGVTESRVSQLHTKAVQRMRRAA